MDTLFWRPNLKIGVQGAKYNISMTMFTINTIWSSFRGLRLAAIERKRMLLSPFLPNNAQHQPFDRFERCLYTKLRVSAFLCFSLPVLKDFFPKNIYLKTYFLVNRFIFYYLETLHIKLKSIHLKTRDSVHWLVKVNYINSILLVMLVKLK